MASQGEMEISFNYHELALGAFRKTLIRRHHRIGDVCVRVAAHYLRMDFLNEAMYVYCQYLAK